MQSFSLRVTEELLLVLNLGILTDLVTQVVQLSASYLTVTNDVDLNNVRGVDGEYLLHAAAVRNTSDGKGLGDAAAVLGDNGTFEHLDSLTGTLNDLVVDTNGVTDVNFGHLSLQLLVCKSFDQIHRKALLVLSGCSCEHAADHPFSVSQMYLHTKCNYYIILLLKLQYLFDIFLLFFKIF